MVWCSHEAIGLTPKKVTDESSRVDLEGSIDFENDIDTHCRPLLKHLLIPLRCPDAYFIVKMLSKISYEENGGSQKKSRGKWT